MASVLETKNNAVERPPADGSLDPYGRLLRMLMPSLRGVVVHDGFANLIWSSDEYNLSDEPTIITEAIANALSDTAEYPGTARTLDADRVIYSFALRGEHIELLGVVSLVSRLAGTQIEPRPLQTVRQLVLPALECLRREMALRIQLGSREHDLSLRDRDLDLVLDLSSKQSEAASDADEFSLILKTALERMGCALAALWVPDKNVSMSSPAAANPWPPSR